MIKKNLFILFHFLLIILLFQPAYAQQSLVFSSIEGDDRVTKICGEVLRVALSKIDIKLEIIALPGARALIMSNKGETDGELTRIDGIDKEYPNLLSIPVPCLEEAIYFFVKSGDEFTVAGWGSLPLHYRVSYRRGIKLIENAAQEFNIEMQAVNNHIQKLMLLDMGRVDATIGTPEQLGQMITAYGVKDIVMLEPPLSKLSIYSYLHKKHTQLIPQLTAVYTQMKENGEIENIKTRIDNEINRQYQEKNIMLN